MKKPPAPPIEPLPKFGWKPVELDVAFEPLLKVGEKPVEVVVASDVLLPFVVDDDGVKPVTDAAGFDGSALDVSPVFDMNKFVDTGEGTGLLPMALANMFDVDVAGGLNFGVGAVGCGVGVVGASLGRARLEGDTSRFSGLSSLTFRFVDSVDSFPVMPLAAARCFFALSILFLISVACW